MLTPRCYDCHSNNTDQQDSAVDSTETRSIISRSESVANLIRSLRSPSTIHGSTASTIYTNPGQHDRELEIDEVLVRSPAYLASYRAIMRGQSAWSKSTLSVVTRRAGHTSSGTSTTESAVAENGHGRRSTGRWSFKTLTWNLSPEARKLAGLLCQAAAAGNIKWIDDLLRKDAYIDGWDTEDRQTPLMYAVIGKRRDTFDYLLERGATLNAKDSAGQTAWHYAVCHHPDIGLSLMQRNILPSADSLRGLLWLAVENRATALLQVLLEGATSKDVNHLFPYKDIFRGCSESLLSKAGKLGRSDIVKLLLDHGASVGQTIPLSVCMTKSRGPNCTHKNATPLHHAHGECAAILIKAGANVFAVDSKGLTPLFWAIEHRRNDPDLAAILTNLEHGSPATLITGEGWLPIESLVHHLLRLRAVSMKTLQIYIAAAKALLNAGSIPAWRIFSQSRAKRELEDTKKEVIRLTVIGHVQAGERGCVWALFLKPREAFITPCWGFIIPRLECLTADDGTEVEGEVIVVPETDTLVSRRSSALVGAFSEFTNLLLES